jgi:hypothetical protein
MVLYHLVEKIFNHIVENIKKFYIFTAKNKIEES